MGEMALDGSDSHLRLATIHPPAEHAGDGRDRKACNRCRGNRNVQSRKEICSRNIFTV